MKFYTFLTLALLLCILPACKQEQSQRVTHRMKQQQAKNTPDKKKIAQPDVMKKKPKSLTFDELQIAKDYSEAIGNKTHMIMYLEHMMKQCSDPNLLKDIYLELADLYFEQGSMELASKLYIAYIDLYPGSPHRAYVHYQAILCKFYSTFSHDRDQTRTEETFKLTQLYLELANNADILYKDYYDDVSSIQKQCCKKLYAHDLDIFNFYYKKGNYAAAKIHLDEIKRMYLTLLHDEIEPDILALECNVAAKLGDSKTVIAKKIELQTKYPQEATIKLASNDPKTDHVARF